MGDFYIYNEHEHEEEPDFDEQYWGSIALSEMFGIDDEKLIKMAKDNNLPCRWWINIPFYNVESIKELALILDKPVPKEIEINNF